MTAIRLLVFFLAMTAISAKKERADDVECIDINDCPLILKLSKKSMVTIHELNTIIHSLCYSETDPAKVRCVDKIIKIRKMGRKRRKTRTRRTTKTIIEVAVPDPPDVTQHPNLRLLNHQACGPEVTQRILGGNRTGVFDYPWMALIGYDVGRGNTQFRCGGTVISERYVLTAAHCVTSLPSGLSLKSVRVGDHDISTERDCVKDNAGIEILCADKYQDFGVENFHFHPKYTRTNLQNDIALIRLNDSVNFTPFNAKPICLPFGSSSRMNTKRGIVTGWGATELGTRSMVLLQARLPLVTNEECKEAYKILSPIWYKQMCAGGQNDVETCLGDSGGPLQGHGIYTDGTVRVIQYGIVSYGPQQCGIAGIPGVYTRVSYYMDWILDNMTD